MLHTFILLALLPAQGKSEAAEVFQKMEVKVSKATSLEMTFDAKVEGLPGEKLNGSLIAANGKKARLELNGEVGGKSMKMVMVSDGSRMKTTGTGDQGPPAQETPKGFDEMIRAIVTRAGVILPLFMIEPARDGDKTKEFKPDEDVAVSSFTLGKTEKLGDRDAQVLEYKLTVKQAKEPFAVTVWVDSKTGLPLKRVVSGKMVDQKIAVTETYTKLTLDGKLDESKFVLPK